MHLLHCTCTYSSYEYRCVLLINACQVWSIHSEGITKHCPSLVPSSLHGLCRSIPSFLLSPCPLVCMQHNILRSWEKVQTACMGRGYIGLKWGLLIYIHTHTHTHINTPTILLSYLVISTTCQGSIALKSACFLDN